MSYSMTLKLTMLSDPGPFSEVHGQPWCLVPICQMHCGGRLTDSLLAFIVYFWFY